MSRASGRGCRRKGVDSGSQRAAFDELVTARNDGTTSMLVQVTSVGRVAVAADAAVGADRYCGSSALATTTSRAYWTWKTRAVRVERLERAVALLYGHDNRLRAVVVERVKDDTAAQRTASRHGWLTA